MKDSITNSEKKKVIEKKSLEILRRLNLNIKNSNIVNQLGIILRLYKYVVQNIHKDSNISLENESGTKEEEYVNGLYCGITNNPGFQTTNAILLKHLLYMKGFDSYIALSKSRTGVEHVSNLAKVGKEWYFFDTNLERSIYEENENQGILFCCAALGKDEYSKFYSPIGVLPENLKSDIADLPSNVAEESMPRTLIDSIVSDIPDLCFTNEFEFPKNSTNFREEISKPVKTEKEERE